MSSRPRHLPRELVDTVIDELWEETACLVACALVHSTWRVRAQHHLYRDKSIPLLRPVGRGNHQLFRFAQSLQENPELGRLMRSVVIQGTAEDEDDDSGCTYQPLDTESFEARCNALLSIIPLLERVEKVTIEDCVDDTKWPSLPIPLQHAIFGLCFQPTVTSLHLVAVEGIPTLPFARCHHLESLQMSFISPDPAELDAPFPLNSREDPTQSVSPTPRRPLGALLLNSTHDDTFLQYLFMEGVLQSSALKTLSLRSDPWHSPEATADLLRLFGLCRDTLVTYEVAQEGVLDLPHPQGQLQPGQYHTQLTGRVMHTDFQKTLLQLDLIPNIQSLTFELNYYYLEMIPEQQDVLGDIAEALKLLSVPGNALKSFLITVTFEYPTDSALGTRQRTLLPQRWFEQWLALDNVLSSPNFKANPSAKGRALLNATVLLDYDQIKFKGVPLPQKPKDALQILSQLETLQIFRLPTKWSDTDQCLVW
ncbi:hypothetical protein BKA70DRAFT_1568387, partial [Coprinopsis sp. MPI-PUGE-AT-0042]